MKSIELKTIGAPLWARLRKDIAALNDRIDHLHEFTYVLADSLPTASADTMYTIYFVPADNPGEDNYMEEFITTADTSTTPTTYAWEKIGSTTVDLDNISDVLVGITPEEFNAIFN